VPIVIYSTHMNIKCSQIALFVILTFPLVHDPEIAICCYKVLLQEYVKLRYRFPSKGHACSAKDSPANAPLAPCGLGVFTKYDTKSDINPHSTEQDT
jgi:hypothetical protein